MKKILLLLVFLTAASSVFGAAGDVIFKQVNPGGTAITDRVLPLPTPLTDRIYGLSGSAQKPAQFIIGGGLSLTGSYPDTLILSSTGGTVTSVGLSMPSGFSVTNSPVTTSGTLTVTTTLSGIIVGDGSGFIARTITGTSNEITVTNGTGISGNPTLSLPSSLTFTGKTVTGGTFVSGAFNGTVGATTPSSVAATTLSTNNLVTVSNGSSGEMLRLNVAGNFVTGGPAFITFNDGSAHSSYIGHGGVANAFDISSSISGGVIRFLPSSSTVSASVTSTGFQGAIGATTPSTVAATTLTTIGSVGIGNALVGDFRSAIGYNGQSGIGGITLNDASTAGSNTSIRFIQNGGQVGTIVTSNTATAYNTSSDRRLKTNIRDFKASGPIIDQIQPRVYDWKSGEKNTVGFVAQELYEVFPAAVTKGDDGEKIKNQWAVDYSKLVPVLVAEIQSLRSRVKALEKK